MGEYQVNFFIVCLFGMFGVVGIEVEVVWDVKMEDVGDVIDINVFCGNVCGDQNMQLLVVEVLYDLVVLCLIKVIVYSICFVVIVGKLFCYFCCFLVCVVKYEFEEVWFYIEKVVQCFVVFCGVQDYVLMVDIYVVGVLSIY